MRIVKLIIRLPLALIVFFGQYIVDAFIWSLDIENEENKNGVV